VSNSSKYYFKSVKGASDTVAPLHFLFMELPCLTSQAVKHPQHSVLFRFTHKTARQESSKFYSHLRNANSFSGALRHVCRLSRYFARTRLPWFLCARTYWSSWLLGAVRW